MKRDGLWIFFVATFAVTWGFGALYALFPRQLVATVGPPSGTNLAFRIAVAAPTYVGLVLAAVTAGRAGIADIFARLFRWRFALRWWAAPIGIAALSLGARALAGALSAADVLSAHWDVLIVAGITAFISDPGPLGEELGWRGFALPRLEQRWSGLTAALFLGMIWGIWHLPAFFIPGLPQNTIPVWTFMITIVSFCVLIVWVVNNTGGSVLIAILMHWAGNRFEGLDARTAPYTAAAFGLAALAVVLAAGPSLGAARMRPPPFATVKPK